MKDFITQDITWAGAFAILFLFLGIAAVFNGWPDIHIGRKEIHYHNDEEKD